MATLKLTDQAVRNLAVPTADGPYTLITWDGDISGFGVRVSRKGVRTFFYNYRSPIDKKTQRGRTIGIWTGDAKGLTVAAARDAAKVLRRKVEDGRDPVAEEERAEEEAKAARQGAQDGQGGEAHP